MFSMTGTLLSVLPSHFEITRIRYAGLLDTILAVVADALQVELPEIFLLFFGRATSFSFSSQGS